MNTVKPTAACGLSLLFSYSDGKDRLLFLIGTSAMLLAFVIDAVALVRQSTPEHLLT